MHSPGIGSTAAVTATRVWCVRSAPAPGASRIAPGVGPDRWAGRRRVAISAPSSEQHPPGLGELGDALGGAVGIATVIGMGGHQLLPELLLHRFPARMAA